jgi:lipoprotein-anchoring transpeptidase ErfK/SrfK
VANFPPSLPRRALASLVLAPALLLSACGTDEPEQTAQTAQSADETTTTTTTTRPPAPVEVPEDTTSYVATANERQIDVYARRDDDEPERTIRAGQAVSVPSETPVTFLVERARDERVLVHLPVRPNGSTGWIDRDDVEISPVYHRVEVTLSDFRVRVYEQDEVILEEPIGVGREQRPTPGGVYYIKELLRPPDPDSIYGTYAYGLSGYSPVLESFNGGPGVIGLHGTNDPDSIGRRVSSGCIRVENDVIERMVEEIGLPLGTPVEIVR